MFYFFFLSYPYRDKSSRLARLKSNTPVTFAARAAHTTGEENNREEKKDNVGDLDDATLVIARHSRHGQGIAGGTPAATVATLCHTETLLRRRAKKIPSTRESSKCRTGR
jgi:hypothetical protein